MPAALVVTPRKHPRQARSMATVDAILTAATRILVEDGYAKTTTNRIAEIAGVSIGSLYQYFPNKDAIVDALGERHDQQVLAILQDKLPGLVGVGLPIAARELVTALLECHMLEPELHRVLIEQVPRVGDMDRVRNTLRTAGKLVHTYLQIRKDDLRVKNIELAVFIVVHAVEVLCHSATLEHPEYLKGNLLVDEVTDLIVRYLQD